MRKTVICTVIFKDFAGNLLGYRVENGYACSVIINISGFFEGCLAYKSFRRLALEEF